MGKLDISVFIHIGHFSVSNLDLSKYVAHQWHVSQRMNTLFPTESYSFLVAVNLDIYYYYLLFLYLQQRNNGLGYNEYNLQ
jgi:hypothetical protein